MIWFSLSFAVDMLLFKIADQKEDNLALQHLNSYLIINYGCVSEVLEK